LEVARSFDYGTDGERDFRKASDHYAKPAGQCHRSAQGNLLLQHALGQAKIYEPAEVFSQLMNRAESKDAEAQNNLGLCFQFGYGAGQDYKKAAVWFRRAAEGGLATAQFKLAVSILRARA
jgi:TPR repeat protein